MGTKNLKWVMWCDHTLSGMVLP